MAEKEHTYNVSVRWIGNEGEGTRNYTSYSRDHEIHGPGKPLIPGSSDPSFRGNSARWNPEEMLVAALSACHKLWYLHLCSQADVIVLEYRDDATGTMRETEDGGGHFVNVTLHPRVIISAESDSAVAERLHRDVPPKCFIAQSVNFPVEHRPLIVKQER